MTEHHDNKVIAAGKLFDITIAVIPLCISVKKRHTWNYAHINPMNFNVFQFKSHDNQLGLIALKNVMFLRGR